MKNPPHPGLSVRHDCIESLGLTITFPSAHEKLSCCCNVKNSCKFEIHVISLYKKSGQILLMKSL